MTTRRTAVADDGLVAFLRERLREDEEVAREFERNDPGPWSILDKPGGCILDKDGRRVVGDGYYDDPYQLRHYYRFSPARVLSEVGAKRRILDLHQSNGHPFDADYAVCIHDERPYPCPSVRLLAVPYDQHPAYRKEWAP